MACAVTLVIARFARAHYFVMLVPSALFLAAWLWRAGRPRLAAAHLAVPAVLVVLHYSLMNVVGWYGLLGIGTTFWYIASCAALLRLDAAAAAAVIIPLPDVRQRQAPRSLVA